MNERTTKVESIFLVAMELASPEERERYLNEACAGDLALRREVDALLQSGEAAEALFQAGREACRVAETTPAPILTEKPGDRIGRYKLLEQIGEGGMGVVYMAEQREPVVRKVALKIIKPGMDSRQVVARFEAERQALALMDHPNIARVLDGGVTETGRPYFVMDLVQGLPITKFCDDAGLSTHERLRLFLEVCSAVQHAHQKGLIHRDLKPANILVTLHGDKPVPKVIDFGVAKATQGRLTDKTLFTSFQQFVGTPAYMSPEQTSLSGLDIDTRSDIYALGVLLYELLTGQTPFDAQELIKAGLDEMRRRIREQEPPRPSTRLSTLAGKDLALTARQRQANVTELMAAVRGDLDWIVMKCLEKDRSRRYETANGLTMDIQRHLNNEPILARPPSQLYRFQKLVRRNKLAVAAAGAIAFALVSGLGLSTWSLMKEKQALRRAIGAEQEQGRLLKEADASRQHAKNEEEKAKTEAVKSQQVAQFLKEMLNGVGPSVALGRDTKLLREIVDQTTERVGNDLKEHPRVEAELRSTLGDLYHALGDYAKAEAMHREALAIRRKIFGDKHADVATSANSLATALKFQNKLPEARQLYEEALKSRKELYGDEHPDVANSLTGLAGLLGRQFRWPEAETIYRQVLALQIKLHGREDPAVATALDNLVEPLSKLHKLDEAESIAREVLDFWRRFHGPEHPDVAGAMLALARIFYEQGKLIEAESLGRETLAMQRKLAVGSAQMANTLFHLGRTVRLLARDSVRRAEAESLLSEALTMRRQLYANDHPYVWSIIDELAPVLLQQGKYAEAETLYREAAAIHQKRANPFNLGTARSFDGLGATLRKQGKLAEAEVATREALKCYLANAKAGDPIAQFNLAVVYAEGTVAPKDEAQAVTWFQKAAEKGLARAQDYLGWMYANGRGVAKDEVEAVKWYRKAADQGHGHAQEYLGWMYANGKGAARDDAEAIRWYRKAAEHGLPGAAFNLGNMYAAGLGVAADMTEAAKFYRAAAEQGNVLAQVKLGCMCATGRGVARDMSEAAAWLRRAGEQKNSSDLNEAAWALATSPDAGLRDGTNAVVFAEKAVGLTSRTNANFVDTLAAAYAELGQFDKAVAIQREAIALNKDASLKDELALHLKLYESNSPFRQ
jgi:serine/threonine protein kinase/TPR repeat protein